jgi:predicted peptidase
MRKVLPIILLVSILFAINCASTGKNLAKKPGQQVSCQMDKKVEVKAGYLLYLPGDYERDKEKQWPMIFFLHGAGERGGDLDKVTVHGPPKLVKNDPNFPFVVLSPQCPEDRFWDNFTLMALLDDIVAKYRIDPDRIYLTGISMGGYGTWSLATNFPDRFAAIAPICGGGAPTLAAFHIKNLPIWAFHGAKDSVVPIAETQQIVDALKAKGVDVRFTVYPDADHDSWTETYNNPELYQWFLSHKRGQK